MATTDELKREIPPTSLEDDRFRDPVYVNRIISKGIRRAILEHKLAGVPIAVFENGKVRVIPPEEIVVPEEHA